MHIMKLSFGEDSLPSVFSVFFSQCIILKLKLSVLQNDVKYEMSIIETLGKKNVLSRNVNLYILYKQATADAILYVLASNALHIFRMP